MGSSAIAMAQKEQPNIIILDFGLPSGDGFVVMQDLQKRDSLASIPVIVLFFGKPTGEPGTVERTIEDDAVVKWDDDGRKRMHRPSLKKI